MDKVSKWNCNHFGNYSIRLQNLERCVWTMIAPHVNGFCCGVPVVTYSKSVFAMTHLGSNNNHNKQLLCNSKRYSYSSPNNMSRINSFSINYLPAMRINLGNSNQATIPWINHNINLKQSTDLQILIDRFVEVARFNYNAKLCIIHSRTEITWTKSREINKNDRTIKKNVLKMWINYSESSSVQNILTFCRECDTLVRTSKGSVMIACNFKEK